MRSEKDSVPFGSEEDEVAASRFLAVLELDEQQLKKNVLSHFTIKYARLSEVLILIHFMINFFKCLTFSTRNKKIIK